ncbi:hypothetical protein BUL40_06020 [Croceivirga radicis]|uniref:Activator of Hsp90 ATPase homologue 1/2-like C-terminal domain-containing protein n=1 Tax=Croceivirga radicis TaxID=1929488 RepID=A0A1V6LT77_9FLAO|nr:SRPBCC domain-containing protein [Croceivirga radicis]OQD43384.1 hypothetical protein BUL40_06020 [Croceivirga radicis]
MLNKDSFHLTRTANAQHTLLWETYTNPDHIKHWNYPSYDWKCIDIEVNLKEGGFFKCKLQSVKDDFLLEFNAVFNKVITNRLLDFTESYGRNFIMEFTPNENGCIIMHKADYESQNSVKVQQEYISLIIDNYITYSEKLQQSLL